MKQVSRRTLEENRSVHDTAFVVPMRHIAGETRQSEADFEIIDRVFDSRIKCFEHHQIRDRWMRVPTS